MSFLVFYKRDVSYTNYLAGVIETTTKDASYVVPYLIKRSFVNNDVCLLMWKYFQWSRKV